MGGLLVIKDKLTASIVLLGLAVLIQDARTEEQLFETAASLSAANLLPAELLQGEHYQVDDLVKSDGYLNYYTIRSDYGEFEAVSTAMLTTRIAEIKALGVLEELSKTEVFAKAAADAGVRQIKSIQQFATHPVETVVGIPSGIGRMFKRYKRQAGEAKDATQEFVAGGDEETGDDEEAGDDGDSGDKSNAAVDLTESYLGVGKAQRNWSRKLGTDPYSSNEVLQAAIKEVAWADRLGKFGMGFAGIPKIPGADIIKDVNEAVWSKDPYELRDINYSRLVATGADETLIEEYLANPRMTPSQQTLLTAAIAEFEGVSGRDGLLRQSLNPKTESEISFYIKSLAMLAWYHRTQNPVASVDTAAAIPAAILASGAMVRLFAADHLYWTETVAIASGNYTDMGEVGRKREIWLLGTASERCREEFNALGFDIHEDVAALYVDNSDL